ncbi:signal peptidase II [Lachnospiraceae bacterium NLAE-zl-G231]|nr:signal peptidase II [Lachnospiraceae bacterium NLAE-zl-G231]
MGYLCIAALIFAGELGIKNYVEKKRNAGEEKEICKGRILLRKYHNKGACMNLGEKKSNVVAGLSLILTAVLALVFLFTLTRHGNGWLKAGLSLLLGGAFSNTYDRLKRKYVVDYFSFGVKWAPLRAIVFNISDFCILIGALIIAIKGM